MLAPPHPPFHTSIRYAPLSFALAPVHPTPKKPDLSDEIAKPPQLSLNMVTRPSNAIQIPAHVITRASTPPQNNVDPRCRLRNGSSSGMPCYRLHRSRKRVQCDRFASSQRVSEPMQGIFRGRRHCCSACCTGPDRGGATEWTKPGFRQGTQAFHVAHVPKHGARR